MDWVTSRVAHSIFSFLPYPFLTNPYRSIHEAFGQLCYSILQNVRSAGPFPSSGGIKQTIAPSDGVPRSFLAMMLPYPNSAPDSGAIGSLLCRYRHAPALPLSRQLVDRLVHFPFSFSDGRLLLVERLVFIQATLLRPTLQNQRFTIPQHLSIKVLQYYNVEVL